MCKNQNSQLVCNGQRAQCRLLQRSVVPQPGWICKLVSMVMAQVCGSPPGGLGWAQEGEARRRPGASRRRPWWGHLHSASLCIFLCELFFTSPIHRMIADTRCFPFNWQRHLSVPKSFMLCQMVVKEGVEVHHPCLMWDTLCVSPVRTLALRRVTKHKILLSTLALLCGTKGWQAAILGQVSKKT